MFKSEQYRAKAAEYQELGKQTDAVSEILELKVLERSYTMMADNEELLQSNFEKTVQASPADRSDDVLATEEERILRCLGAALILQENGFTNVQAILGGFAAWRDAGHPVEP